MIINDPRDCKYRIANVCSCSPDTCDEMEWFEDEEESESKAKIQNMNSVWNVQDIKHAA